MTSLLRSIVAIVAIATLCIAPTGCKPKTVGNSILTATVAGREIRAVIDGPAFIQPGADNAIVSTRANKITVERERVLLDGAELAKLPTAATKVEVTVAAGQLTVTADGAAITTKQLSK
jgi:hypothetical protein